jgi:UDP-N-acetylglucosamine--N-acetylmuramyl-(pentapeptide) pyrophosphoryl-undecaprenol N-acetylglucosamine transferase
MRILWVGGGTGGHLTPALGLAEAMEERGHTCLFLVNGREVEKNYFEGHREYQSLGVDGGHYPRWLALAKACRKARRMAREFNPDLVVALGGSGSLPAMFAKRGCPLVLLEGNFTFGRAVRWMKPFAQLLLTQFSQTAASSKKAVAIGPVRRKLSAPMSKADACRHFGFDPQKPVLLMTGGSQGARQVNQFLAKQCENLVAAEVQVLALVGPGNAADFPTPNSSMVKVLEHCDAMGAAWSAADFALCRGGASTLGELWLHAVPAAIIPYPGHQDHQQERNAQALEPGVLVLDLADPERAQRVFWEALFDQEASQQMAAHLRSTQPPQGLQKALAALEEIAAGKA